ncbi:CLUMA_CG011001, isoform A, partial [Clunio marinus]
MYMLMVRQLLMGRKAKETFIIMVTLLTTKIGLKKSFRTFWMTFTSCELPSWWTFYTLISTGTTACVTTQITLDTTATVTVIAEKYNEN